MLEIRNWGRAAIEASGRVAIRPIADGGTVIADFVDGAQAFPAATRTIAHPETRRA